MEGNQIKKSLKVTENQFFFFFMCNLFQTGVKFWPVVQTFNFALIPERNRVVFVGLASFIWTAYLSFMEASSS